MSGKTQGERKLSRPAANATATLTPTLAAERDRGDHRGPAAVRAAFGGGRDVHGADDFAGEQPLLAPLVPRLVRLERHAKHGRQHRRREILGVFAGDGLALAVAVMLGDVAVVR